MRNRQLRERPENFVLKHDHPLAQGLVFAGFGAYAGSKRYHDSSVFGNTGTLTNMDPATDWVPGLNRLSVKSTANTKYISSEAKVGSNQMSVAVWIKTTNRTAGIYPTVRVSGNGWVFGIDDSPTLSFTSYGLFACSVSLPASFANGSWYHIAFTYDQPKYTFYGNGSILASGTITGDTAILPMSASYKMLYANAETQFADYIVAHSVYPQSLVGRLADPSNVMLSGLINPPRRKLWNITRQIGTSYRKQSLIIGTGNRFLNIGI